MYIRLLLNQVCIPRTNPEGHDGGFFGFVFKSFAVFDMLLSCLASFKKS